MEIIIIKAIVISLAIVGLRIVSSKGMILHILRMPYEYLQNELNMNIAFLSSLKYSEATIKYINEQKRIIVYHKIAIYLLKPIIGCTTCMASFYTIIIEYSYFDLSKWSILTIFMVATINSILFSLYEKLEK